MLSSAAGQQFVPRQSRPCGREKAGPLGREDGRLWLLRDGLGYGVGQLRQERHRPTPRQLL